MKINANFRIFAGTNFDAKLYIPSPAYGVNRFMLDRIGNELARATTIVQYHPNSYVLNTILKYQFLGNFYLFDNKIHYV
jgi:hypothetical protein